MDDYLNNKFDREDLYQSVHFHIQIIVVDRSARHWNYCGDIKRQMMKAFYPTDTELSGQF